jgi:hypothetical protein
MKWRETGKKSGEKIFRRLLFFALNCSDTHHLITYHIHYNTTQIGMTDLRQLFGGALVASVPARFDDVRCAALKNVANNIVLIFYYFSSDFRQVPDNQEVFSDPARDQSVIIELLQYEPTISDDQIAQYHFKEIAAANACPVSEIVSVQPLPPQDAPHFSEYAIKFNL